MNDIKNDTNLREAVSRREQQLPPMSADLNERLMQRLQDADRALSSRSRHIRLYLSIAASILLIICIGTVLFTDKPIHTMVAENKAQPLPSHQGEGLGVGSLTSTPSELFAENCHEKRLQTPPRPSGTPPLDGRGAAARSGAIQNGRGAAARSGAKHELPDTLGDGIWQSERNVVRAMQMLGECEAIIQKSEQEMLNNIIKCTYNATPQPANAVLVTNEAGDCEVIETKTIVEI
ncbi:MAG: hypothetical protein IJT39_04550 [Bacteroidales bacterium]|nr:hypothetical protein [Bacteroidales bacterium]